MDTTNCLFSRQGEFMRMASQWASSWIHNMKPRRPTWHNSTYKFQSDYNFDIGNIK